MSVQTPLVSAAMAVLKRLLIVMLVGFAAALGVPAYAVQADGDAAEPIDTSELDEGDEDDVWDRGCGDDRGTDRCDVEVQERMRALYGWESAEELVRKGIEFRRFMLVDGYGGDVVGVTFERVAGSGPIVRIDAPKPGDMGPIDIVLPPPTPLQASLSAKQWSSVLRLTENFDRELAQESSEDSSDITGFCLHGWFTVMEAGYGAERSDDDESEPYYDSDSESACADGLAMPAAFALTELAYDALPECQSLQIDDFRNFATLLAHCKRLGADRMAALEAKGFMDRLEDELAKDKPSMLIYFELEFPEQKLATSFLDFVSDRNVFWAMPYAHSQHRASVIGIAIEELDQEAETFRYAIVTLQLFQMGSHWRIVSFEISDFKTVQDDNNE